jgi:tetratricopeptide (TPR) repeat protein
VCLRYICLFVTAACWAVNAEPATWAGMMLQGRSLQNQSRFREAKAVFESALQEAQRGPGSAVMQAQSLLELALVKVDLGGMEEAARLCERAASILVKASGEDDPLLQIVRTKLAELYLDSGQIATAAKILRRVVAVQSRTSQAATLQGARALDALACVYARQRRFPAAEKLERQSLSFLETREGSGDLSLAIGNLHLSMILDATGRAADGLPYAERAAQLLKRLPDVQPFLQADSARNLASLYLSVGRREEAEPASRQAVDLVERIYGPDHVYTGWMLLARAAILRRLDRKPEATVAQQRGQRILSEQAQRNHLGDTVPLNALR